MQVTAARFGLKVLWQALKTHDIQYLETDTGSFADSRQ